MIYLTPKEQEFINLTDPDIVTEIMEEQMLPSEIPYFEFYTKYQIRHKQKYGCELIIN